jgi:hypothetical protein
MDAVADVGPALPDSSDHDNHLIYKTATVDFKETLTDQPINGPVFLRGSHPPELGLGTHTPQLFPDRFCLT